MSTARIRQRLIKAGFTELGLEGLSREELMNTLADQMIKEELSVSEEEEEETAPSSAVGGAKVKKKPEKTVESDPLPKFVNPSMTMEGMMQMMRMRRKMKRDEDLKRRKMKRDGDVKRRRNKKRKRKNGDLSRKKKRKNGGNKEKKREICVKQNWRF